jgi:ABC-type polysaccharide/polyol phosphate export permease
MIREQREHRELLLSIVRRDFAVRYKQTLLGLAWAVCIPLLNMLLFTAVFTRIVPLELDMPYPIYAYAGLVPWTFFAASLHGATTSLTSNAGLIGKAAFPREVLPLSTVIIAFVDFVAAAAVLGVLMVYFGVALAWTAVLVPVVIVIQVAFTVGMALLLSLGNLYYRDVRYLSTVGLTLWMFATSVVYPLDRVDGLLGSVLRLNPMTPIIDAYRSLLLRGEVPPAAPLALSAVIAFGTLALAWRVFHAAEADFAERL